MDRRLQRWLQRWAVPDQDALQHLTGKQPLSQHCSSQMYVGRTQLACMSATQRPVHSPHGEAFAAGDMTREHLHGS